jgi:hypothetical protein
VNLSASADEAPEIIRELQAFWTFLQLVDDFDRDKVDEPESHPA